MFVEGIVLRVGGYRLRGGANPHETYGFLFTVDPDAITRGDIFNTRGTLYAALGGGSAGLEGQFEGASTAGAHVGQGAGVAFLRGGFGFQVLGNNDLYRSHIELPRLETGYQVFGESVVFELQGNAGLVLGGRYNVGDGAKRRIDTVPRLGASATLQTDDLRLHVAAHRILAFSTGNGDPIDQVGVDLCGQLGKLVVACAHGAGHRGHVHWRDGSTSLSTALYAGGTVGIGAIDVE